MAEAARPRSESLATALRLIENEDRKILEPHVDDLFLQQLSLKTNDKAKTLFAALEKLDALKPEIKSAKYLRLIEDRLKSIERIIARELNGPDAVGGTPLQGAANADDVDTLRKLIARKADLDKPEPFFGGNVLHVAVHGRSRDCVEEILLHRPHFAHKINRHGVTPYDYAQLQQRTLGGYGTIISNLVLHISRL